MRKSKFFKDAFQANGIIIPSFILMDENLDTDLKYCLSAILTVVILNPELQFKRTVDRSDSTQDGNCFWDPAIKELENKYYVILISKEISETEITYVLEINHWYQQYIDLNPYYGHYDDDYPTYLRDSILPIVKDEIIKNELTEMLYQMPSNFLKITKNETEM